MKPNESDDNFSDRFLHLCYEFPEDDKDLDFLKQKFERLVHISLHDEYGPLDVSTSTTLVNHETRLISEEESTIPLFLILLHFQFRCGCLLAMIIKLGDMIFKFIIHLLILLAIFMAHIQWRKSENGS